MRSRDGDHSQAFSISTIVSLLLLLSSALFADEYLISYRSTIKDAIIYNEVLNVAHAMQKCSQTKLLDEPLTLPNNTSKDLKSILLQNYDAFQAYLQKIGMQIEHNEKTYNGHNHAWTRLTFQTHCFKVDFNENFVIMTPLK